MQSEVRLYNVLFPVFLLFLWPSVWLILLPGNFVFDSLVLLAALRVLGYGAYGRVWRASILRIWGLGFLSDLAGAVLILGVVFLGSRLSPNWNWTLIPGGQLAALPGLLLAGVLIYRLNLRFSFRKAGLDREQARKLSLALAVFTAPYTLLLPIEWLYG